MAGLRAGDILVALNRQPVTDVPFVVSWVAKRRVGETIEAIVDRGGRRITVKVTLGARPRANELTGRTWLNRVLPKNWEFEEALSGRPLTLSKFRGRPLLIVFWATYCGPCKRADPWVETLARRYRGRGLQVIKLSGEKRETVRRFIRRTGTSTQQTVVTDPKHVARDKLLLRSMPTFLYIDEAGFLRGVSHGASSLAALDRDLQVALKPSKTRP